MMDKISQNASNRLQLHAPALAVNENDPWADDTFGAKKIGDRVAKLAEALVRGEDGASSILLSGRYGTGKTFTLRRLQADMAKRGWASLYYNAWENDGDADPLPSLFERFTAGESVGASISGWLNKDAGKKLLEQAIVSVVRHTVGMDLSELASAARPDHTERKELLADSRKLRKNTDAIRKYLACFVQQIRQPEEAPNEGGGALLIIDELDRCRPDFALALLERVKHIMNVPGVVFVFGADVSTLGESVKAVHGNIDADGYLLRIFRFALNMREGTYVADNRQEESIQHWRTLMKRHNVPPDFLDENDGIGVAVTSTLDMLAILSMHGGLTPRQMENVVRDLVWVTVNAEDEHYKMLPHVLAPMLMAKVKAPQAYRRMVSKPQGAVAVINCFRGMVRTEELRNYWSAEQLDTMEMFLYSACHPADRKDEPPPRAALKKIAEGTSISDEESRSLSNYAKELDRDEAKNILEITLNARGPSDSHRGIGEPIPLNFNILRRISALLDVLWEGTTS